MRRIFSVPGLVVIICFLLPVRLEAQSIVFEVNVSKQITLPHIPSASALVKYRDSYFIAGDDSPYLFQLNTKYEVEDSIKIFSTKHLENGRLPKHEKADFECMTVVPWGKDSDLLVFGSGSTGDKSEVMNRVDFDGQDHKVTTYDLAKLYKHIAQKSDAQAGINFEGAGLWKKKLILLNRADNTLIVIDIDDFRDYVKDDKKDKPDIKSIKFNLPAVNGVSARFSGMCLLPEEDILVFSASVENDPNWIDNQNIVGSYIGLIDLNQLENRTPVCERIMHNGKPLQDKVESVYVVSSTNSDIKLLGVTDNDDGSSKLLEIDFRKRTH
ncbi:hypothetical protein ACE1ET_16305 [Saccharicrinis sp. FJH62]|uniref:DUF6929 family protein n=1 Tax=Saccharicrinis sp. FJH62 TaxID=3344657 RepID=UPI0035D48420